MIWYLDGYSRHRREREALETLVSSVNWLISIGWRIDNKLRLIWDADIVTPAFFASVRSRTCLVSWSKSPKRSAWIR